RLFPRRGQRPSLPALLRQRGAAGSRVHGHRARGLGALSRAASREEKFMNRFDLLHTPLAGRNLIEASAGTGKTFTIAGVYLRLVLEPRLAVADILVVTFTEAATKELRERIRKRLKEAEKAFEAGQSDDPLLSGLLERLPDHAAAARLLTNAVRSFDEAAIFTIHGFCQRMLLENPFESGSLCNTELLTDQGTILREIAQDYWRINCYNAPRHRVAAANNAGISPG